MSNQPLKRHIEMHTSITVNSVENPYLGNLTLDDANRGVAIVRSVGSDDLYLTIDPAELPKLSSVLSALAQSYCELTSGDAEFCVCSDQSEPGIGVSEF